MLCLNLELELFAVQIFTTFISFVWYIFFFFTNLQALVIVGKYKLSYFGLTEPCSDF